MSYINNTELPIFTEYLKKTQLNHMKEVFQSAINDIEGRLKLREVGELTITTDLTTIDAKTIENLAQILSLKSTDTAHELLIASVAATVNAHLANHPEADVVSALESRVLLYQQALGTLTALSTVAKGSIVSAVNELVISIAGKAPTIHLHSMADITDFDPVNYPEFVGEQGIQGIQGIRGLTGLTGLTGPEGPQGIQGIPGINGTNGTNGVDGEDGADGAAGADGTSVTILGSYPTELALNQAHPTGSLGDAYLVLGDLYVWNGSVWFNVGTIQGPQGIQGIPGTNGTDGADGYTPIKDTDYFDGADGYTPIKNTDYFDGADGADGEQGVQGEQGIPGTNGTNGTNGVDGYTPVKGVDYFDGVDGSDANVTKENVEGVLVGEIATHKHDNMYNTKAVAATLIGGLGVEGTPLLGKHLLVIAADTARWISESRHLDDEDIHGGPVAFDVNVYNGQTYSGNDTFSPDISPNNDNDLGGYFMGTGFKINLPYATNLFSTALEAMSAWRDVAWVPGEITDEKSVNFDDLASNTLGVGYRVYITAAGVVTITLRVRHASSTAVTKGSVEARGFIYD